MSVRRGGPPFGARLWSALLVVAVSCTTTAGGVAAPAITAKAAGTTSPTRLVVARY